MTAVGWLLMFVGLAFITLCIDLPWPRHWFPASDRQMVIALAAGFILMFTGIVFAAGNPTPQVVLYRTKPHCAKPLAVSLPLHGGLNALTHGQLTMWICEGANE